MSKYLPGSKSDLLLSLPHKSLMMQQPDFDIARLDPFRETTLAILWLPLAPISLDRKLLSCWIPAQGVQRMHFKSTLLFWFMSGVAFGQPVPATTEIIDVPNSCAPLMGNGDLPTPVRNWTLLDCRPLIGFGRARIVFAQRGIVVRLAQYGEDASHDIQVRNTRQPHVTETGATDDFSNPEAHVTVRLVTRNVRVRRCGLEGTDHLLVSGLLTWRPARGVARSATCSLLPTTDQPILLPSLP